MADKSERKASKAYDPTTVRDISVVVYKIRLGVDDVRRINEEHQEKAEGIMRSNAAAYDSLTRAYINTVLDFHERGALKLKAKPEKPEDDPPTWGEGIGSAP